MASFIIIEFKHDRFGVQQKAYRTEIIIACEACDVLIWGRFQRFFQCIVVHIIGKKAHREVLYGQRTVGQYLPFHVRRITHILLVSGTPTLIIGLTCIRSPHLLIGLLLLFTGKTVVIATTWFTSSKG